MRIIVSNKIRVNIADLTQRVFDKVKIDLRFDNPEYEYYVRAGKTAALQYASKYIYGFKIHDSVLYLDRAYLSTLLSHLKRAGLVYNVIYKYNVNKTKWYDNTGHIDLWNYQEDAFERMMKFNNGILVMPCGSGKTRIMLKVIQKRRQWALVLVHTTELLNQWKDYVTKILHKECGIIQGDTVDIKPLTIAMVQTLSRRVLTPKFKRLWGVVALDEAHHAPAESFSKLLNEFPAKYRMGATATVKRSDKLEGLLFSVCGFPRYTIGLGRLEELGYVVKPQIVLKETNYFSRRRTNNYARVVTQLIRDEERQKAIVATILEHREHYNLVLSNRIEHLETMFGLYREKDDRCELLVGRVKEADRKRIIEDMRSGRAHTLFASTLADEGLDIPILDRLFMTVSTKALGKVEQRIGRIQRVYPGKTDALVFDFVDSYVPMFDRHFRERMNLYRAIGVSIGGQRYEVRRSSYQIVRAKREDKKATGFKGKIAKFVGV